MTLQKPVRSKSKPEGPGRQWGRRRCKKTQGGRMVKTHPHRLTSITFFQVSKPSSAVPFAAIPALLRRTATYSSTCSLVSPPISPKLRQNKTRPKITKAHNIGTVVRTSPKASYALSLSRCTCSRLLTSVGTTSTFFSPTSAAISRPSMCTFSTSISARTTLSPCLSRTPIHQSVSQSVDSRSDPRGRRTRTH